MAEHQDKNKEIEKMKAESKNVVSKVIQGINKSSCTKQLLFGSVSGWATGFATIKVGKTAAIAIGSSIILFQIAQDRGYIKMDWSKVKEKAEKATEKVEAKYGDKAPQWVCQAKRFAKNNTCFAAGFVGGFLIGLAS